MTDTLKVLQDVSMAPAAKNAAVSNSTGLIDAIGAVSAKANEKTSAATSTGTVYNTKGAGLNVRKGPGTNYGKIGYLSEGSKVTVLEKSGSWYKIQYEAKTGYVSGKYLKVDDAISTISSDAKNDEPVVKDDPVAKKEEQTAKTEEPAKTEETKDSNDGPKSEDAAMADFIRTSCPDGINTCFAYNGSNQAGEFQGQADKFSKEYSTIGLKDTKLNMPHYSKIKKYEELKSGILNTQSAVKKCLADNPKKGYDDSKCSVIKNLTIMCHGNIDGLSFGSNSFKTKNIQDFTDTVRSSLASDVRVQLYACNTAINNYDKRNWFERRGTAGQYGADIQENDPFQNGKGSFAQMLAEGLGDEASVYGHTTAGHLSGNYAARCYGKDAGYAENGKHMFDIYFPQDFVAEQAARLGKDEVKVRTSMYNYYTSNYDDDKRGRDTFMDPEGKGKSMRDGWLKANP